MPGKDPRMQRLTQKQKPKAGKAIRGTKKKPPVIIMMDGREFLLDPGKDLDMMKFSKGGRAGFKSGSKSCKLAMKGKGRAYGKNS